jgi:carboxyl-terminal processing protease
MIDNETAYLKITRWTPFTEESVKEAADFFESKGYGSLIVDVRGNPGGLLTSVVDVSDMFLAGGEIVSTKDRELNVLEQFNATKNVVFPEEIPVILLTDKGSASASEILAGALKDSGRAYLIGNTTFGKGSVQQIRGFGDGGFKLTTSRYYSPDDYNIDKIGIEPHKIITEPEMTDEELESLADVIENNRTGAFVARHPERNPAEIDDFIRELRNDGNVLEERIIRKLIREEYNRSLNVPPVYDLEYDRVLQYALELIQSGEL